MLSNRSLKDLKLNLATSNNFLIYVNFKEYKPTTNLQLVTRNDNFLNPAQTRTYWESEQEIQTFPRDESNKFNRPLIKSVIQHNAEPILQQTIKNPKFENVGPNKYEELKKDNYYETYKKIDKSENLKSEKTFEIPKSKVTSNSKKIKADGKFF